MHFIVIIDDFQPIPRDSEDKGLAAMLVPQANIIILFKLNIGMNIIV